MASIRTPVSSPPEGGAVEEVVPVPIEEALQKHIETHGGIGSERIKSIVFGGLDGVITTFSIVAAVAGAQLPIETALLMGFSNLIADGISMGLGDFLSSKAEMEFEASESKREMWEFENSKEVEVAEQEKLFEEKGMTKEDASSVTATLAKYPDIFHDIHLPAELGFSKPDADASPATDGLVSAWDPPSPPSPPPPKNVL